MDNFTPVVNDDGHLITVKSIDDIDIGRKIIFSEDLPQWAQERIIEGDAFMRIADKMEVGYMSKLLFKPNDSTWSFEYAWKQECIKESIGITYYPWRPSMFYNSNIYKSGWNSAIDYEFINPSDYKIEVGCVMAFVKEWVYIDGVTMYNG